MKDCLELAAPKFKDENVFSSMFSLLYPPAEVFDMPANLALPPLFGFSNLLDTDSFLEDSDSECLEKLEDEGKRKAKPVTACPHPDRKHYAKNMCNNCYHRLGRNRNAWNCTHQDRQHYAKGKCQLCYLQHYHKTKAHGRRKGRRNRRMKTIKNGEVLI